MVHFVKERESGPVAQLLADMSGGNPELFEGYLMVGVQIDGSMVIGHNTCCLAHAIAHVLAYLRANPDINVPHPGLPNAHDL